MWYDESVFYQIYPLGLCGAPQANDGVQEHRLRRILDWIPHIEKLGCGAVLLNPLFESDAHGYDTRDYPPRGHRAWARTATSKSWSPPCTSAASA